MTTTTMVVITTTFAERIFTYQSSGTEVTVAYQQSTSKITSPVKPQK